jgi:hypothetical protein
MKKTIDTAMFAAAIVEIKAIVAEVENNWLAADGGLTEAACDVRRMGGIAIRQLEEIAGMPCTADNLIEWYWSGEDWYNDAWNYSTGTEIDICFIMHRTLCTDAARDEIWERWRKEAGALHGETPRALIERLYKKGKIDIYEIPCPPDRDQVSDWYAEIADLCAEWDGEKWRKVMGKDFPSDVCIVHGCGWCYTNVDLSTWTPKSEKWTPEFTGVHYRRAAAMGIKL